MLYGISAAPIPTSLNLPYAPAIQQAALALDWLPCVAYAVGWRETIRGRAWLATLGQTPENAISGDGGHGIYQLTSFVPPQWDDPYTNAYWAIHSWLKPDMEYFNQAYGLVGDDLIRITADSFNEGRQAAINYHLQGNADAGTTHANYGADVLNCVHFLLAGNPPPDTE